MSRPLRHVLRSVTVYLFIPLVLLLILRLVWGYESSRRLAAAIAALRAIPDPPQSAPPGAKNAVQVLSALLDGLIVDKAQLDWMSGEEKDNGVLNSAWTPKENQRIASIINTHQSLLARIDSLPVDPLAQMPIPLPEGLEQTYSDPREFVKYLLMHSARMAMDERQDALLLHRLWQSLRLGNIFSQIPQGEDQLQGIFNSRFLPLNCLELYLPQLQLTDPEAASQARHLIPLLLDDSFFAGNGSRAWRGDALLIGMSPHDRSDYLGWWGAPLQDDSVARLVEHSLVVLPAFSALDYQHAAPFLAKYPDIVGAAPDLVMFLDSIENSTRDSPWASIQFRAELAGRATAVLLAARLYFAHTGHYPTSASDLVPDFLPAIPADPYSSSQLLHYRLDAQGPTVWSVGDDGIDGGGVTILVKPTGRPQDRFRQPDIIFGAAWPRATVPAPALTPPANPPSTTPSAP